MHAHADERARLLTVSDLLSETVRWVVCRTREHPADLAPNLFTVGRLLATDEPPRPADHTVDPHRYEADLCCPAVRLPPDRQTCPSIRAGLLVVVLLAASRTHRRAAQGTCDALR